MDTHEKLLIHIKQILSYKQHTGKIKALSYKNGISLCKGVSSSSGGAHLSMMKVLEAVDTSRRNIPLPSLKV